MDVCLQILSNLHLPRPNGYEIELTLSRNKFDIEDHLLIVLIQQRIPLFARIMRTSKVGKVSIISNDISEHLRSYYRICSRTLTSKQHSTIEEWISDSLNETKKMNE